MHLQLRDANLTQPMGGRSVRAVKSVFGPFVVRVEHWPDQDHDSEMAYGITDEGRLLYVGDAKTARFLYGKGITEHFQSTGGDEGTLNVGFCPRLQAWWGWSHRAMASFRVGSKVPKDFTGKQYEPGFCGRKLKTLDECRRAALAHAEGVS